jgi:hypothetical protein
VKVLSVPTSLDGETIDSFFDHVAPPDETRHLFDARHLRWVDPNGMVGLLVAGTVRKEAGDATAFRASRIRRCVRLSVAYGVL